MGMQENSEPRHNQQGRSNVRHQHTFAERETQATAAGLELDRENQQGHRYNLWFNSPTGSKEILLLNLGEEFDAAFGELTAMRAAGV